MGLTFQRADAQADLDWWARNHGTGMPQNWPIFEVKCPVLFRRAWLMHLSGPIQSGQTAMIVVAQNYICVATVHQYA